MAAPLALFADSSVKLNRTISDGEKLGCWEGGEACRSGGAKAPVFEIE